MTFGEDVVPARDPDRSTSEQRDGQGRPRSYARNARSARRPNSPATMRVGAKRRAARSWARAVRTSRMITIALGTAPLSACAAADPTSDGQVGINDLVLAVLAALQGCPT